MLDNIMAHPFYKQFGHKKNHYSPVFANSYWTNQQKGNHYAHYYRCPYDANVKVSPHGKGRKAWGHKKNLYTKKLENRLDKELEEPSSKIYKKLVQGEKLNANERCKWGQFILSQFVRMPTFQRYQNIALNLTKTSKPPLPNEIIGCEYCYDNRYVACRNWVILIAHRDDQFIRTDNPVYMTGFISHPNTTIFYPLTPKKCFVACSMPEILLAMKEEGIPFPKQEEVKLEKGDAFYLNFEFSKAADDSIIMDREYDNQDIGNLIKDTLGVYPQVPFLLHDPKPLEIVQATESLRYIMSIADEIEYPIKEHPWNPYLGIEHTMGINKFSVLGFTNEALGIKEE